MEIIWLRGMSGYIRHPSEHTDVSPERARLSSISLGVYVIALDVSSREVPRGQWI
jgi:hypothetical protein